MGYIEGSWRRKSVWKYLHIDFPLLVALLILLGFGLMVLYSATDGNMSMMGRQSSLYYCFFGRNAVYGPGGGQNSQALGALDVSGGNGLACGCDFLWQYRWRCQALA